MRLRARVLKTDGGFGLVELLISLVVTAIVGGALIRMVLSQARFMDQQEAWRGARNVARGGINLMLSDLRAVEASGGLQAAAAGGQDFTVRVPYAWGVTLRDTKTTTSPTRKPGLVLNSTELSPRRGSRPARRTIWRFMTASLKRRYFAPNV